MSYEVVCVEENGIITVIDVKGTEKEAFNVCESLNEFTVREDLELGVFYTVRETE